MASATVIPGAQALSEWFSRVGGVIAGCGQASVLVVQHILTGQPLSTSELTSVIAQSVASGNTVSPGGATTPANLVQIGAAQGISLQQHPGSAWQSVLGSAAGHTPVILGVSNASAFGGADSGVQGHYVTVVGTDGQGNFLVADPNQAAAVSGGFMTYSRQQIQNADPFAVLTPSGTSTSTTSTTSTQSYTTGGGNPLDIVGAIQGIPASIGHGILAAVGATSGPDLLFRAALIIVGLILLVWALVHLFEPSLHEATGAVATVGKVAALAG